MTMIAQLLKIIQAVQSTFYKESHIFYEVSLSIRQECVFAYSSKTASVG
jgi:hypothetical protein